MAAPGTPNVTASKTSSRRTTSHQKGTNFTEAGAHEDWGSGANQQMMDRIRFVKRAPLVQSEVTRLLRSPNFGLIWIHKYSIQEPTIGALLTPIVSQTNSAASVQPAPRLPDVRAKRIGFVDNSKLNADIFLGRIAEILASRFGINVAAKIRKFAPKDPLTQADLSKLAECEAVVLCFGDCGTSTSVNVADAVDLERLGIPTATVFSTAFADAARSQAQGRGMDNLHLVRIPHPMHTAPRDVVLQRADKAVDEVVTCLTRETKVETKNPKPATQSGDDADGAQELFFARGWTDGLPVVTPSAAKVEQMIEASGRDACDTVGLVPPRWREATIEKLAINAVMAGCLPEYFPVVLTAFTAALEHDCQLYGIQTATNTTAPLIVVNGVIAQRLDINSGGNLLGQGRRANATIGRALQLILRNIGGDIPGETDMSTHGHAGKFTFCMAEAEAESPWTPFHVDVGFDPSDSTVTVIGASAPQNVFTYGCENGEEILDHLIGAMLGLGHNNIIFPTGPVLVLSPEHASTLARDGIGKRDIQNAVFERARIPLTRFAKRSAEGLKHRRSRWFSEVGDEKHIGVADKPGDVHIFVAGGAGIHSLFVPTAFSFRPVTKKIEVSA